MQKNYPEIPQTYLIDKRDNKSYVVRKLADGNCWMAQNLALYGGAEIESTLSNVEEGFTYTLPASSTAGFNNNAAAFIFNGNNTYQENTPTSTGSWYSWCTAVVGTCAKYSTGNAEEDICPKNWQLPTGGGNGQFNTLYAAYGSNITMFHSVWEKFYTGSYSSGALSSAGGQSLWWSRTANGATAAYNLYVYPTNGIKPSYSESRYYGFFIRCVAK